MSDTPRVGIEVSVDGSGVEAGLARVDAAVTRTGRTLDTLGERGGAALSEVGGQGTAAAGRVDSATRNMVNSIQRATVAMSAGAKGSAEYFAALANSRGLNVAALKPYLDQLDAVTKKTAAAAEAQRQLEANTRFLEGLRSQAEGIGKTASQLAALRAEQLGVADAARPFIEQIREAEEAASGATESFSGMAQAISAIAFGGSVAAVVQLSDEYGKYVAQLRLATEGQTEFQNAQNAVRRIATTSQADLSATASLYASITKGTRELGLAQTQVANITETVSLALKVSGASGAEASSAILQLSQAFASGTLRGDEFNSVNEAAPRLMQALADGMGVPIGALRKMAEEGQLTTAVLADALPRALGALRDEGKSVESIAGAYTVLKNNVLEMVGATAQSNGVVAALSGSINLLAGNLTLAAGAMTTVVAVKLGASLAAAARDAYAAAAANQARLTSNLAAARADVAAAASASALASARVAELRASVLAADGAVALAIATNGLIPAQSRATAASAAHTAALSAQTAAMGAASLAGRAASGALALLGGPVGAVIGLLGVAATAWAVWGESAEKSEKKVSETTEASTEEVIASLDKQIAKLKERNRLASIGIKPADIQAPGGEKLAEVISQIDRVGKGEGDYGKLSLQAKTEVLKVLGKQYGELTTKIAEFNRESEIETNNRNKKSAGEWMQKYATNSEKLTAELKKAKDELGSAFTPELEARIRKQFEERKKGLDKEASAYKELTTAIDGRITETAREAAGLKPLTDSQKLQVALDESLASGKLKLTAAQKAEYEGKIKSLAANESVIDSQKRAAQGQAEIEKLYKSLAEERKREIDAARQEAERNEQVAATYGMTKLQIEELTLARLEDQYAQRESGKLQLEDIEHLRTLIDLKKRSVDALKAVDGREVAAKTAKEAEEAWKRTAATIEESLTDALMRGFESGKSFAENLRDATINMFKTMVLRPTIQAALQPMSSSLTSAFQGSSAGGGSTFGSAMDLISTGKTIYSGFTGGMAATMGGYISSLGNLFGSTAISSFGAGMGLTSAQAAAAASAYTSAATAATAAGNGAAAASYTSAAGGLSAGAGSSSMLPVIGWIIAGMMSSNSLYKQGWDFNNGSVNKLGQNLGSGINLVDQFARKLGLSDSAANIISGLAPVSKLFGRRNPTIEEQGMTGTLTASGFSGESYANILEKGGWFRSDKRYTRTAAIDGENDAAFDSTMTAMVSAVKGFGSALGVETSAIDGYNKAIKLTLTNDEEKNKEAISKMFTGVADDLATLLVPSIAKFSADGETASTTLQRVATNFASVSSLMQAIGVDAGAAFGTVGVASIEARERLISLAGGVDALASQSSFFAQNFLTQAEQVAPAQKALREQLAALGYAELATSEQFKAAVLQLASSGALATEAGAKTYEALLALAPAFKTVTDAAEQAAKERASLEGQIFDLANGAAAALARQRKEELAAMDASLRPLQERIYALQDEKSAAEAAAESADSLISNADNALSVFQQIINREKTALQEAHAAEMAALEKRITVQSEAASKFKSLADSLKSTLGQMEVPDGAESSRSQAQAEIRAALAIARSGGPLPAADSLKGALAAITRDTSDQFSSYTEYMRDFYATANDVAGLGDLADSSLSVAEKTLAALEKQKDVSEAAFERQIAGLDALVNGELEQINLLKGMDTSLLTIAQGQDAVALAIAGIKGSSLATATGSITQAYQSTLGRNPDAAGLEYWQSMAAGGTSIGSIMDSIKGSPEAQIRALYKDVLGRVGDAEGIAYFVDRLQKGVPLAELRADMIRSEEYKKLHPFAVGTNYVPQTMPALVHEGERIIPAADNRALMAMLRQPARDDSALVAEIRALRAEVAELRKPMQQAADGATGTRDLIDKVSAGGNAFAVEDFTQ